MNSITVNAEWDPEALVWVATSDDVPGLVAEATSIEKLRPKLLAMISDLIELNGIDTELKEIPVHIIAQATVSMKLVPAS
jgi:predicted RNase H-like HicB family nuclease